MSRTTRESGSIRPTSQSLNPRKLDEWFGNAKVRVLAGCAPCQPFSSYALRYQKEKDVEDDERWSLLDHFGRLVSVMSPSPDIVTMENVPTVTKHAVFKRLQGHARAIRLQGLGRGHRLREVRAPAAPQPNGASRVAPR
jgi:site-specific DNA-cytosine methylase